MHGENIFQLPNSVEVGFIPENEDLEHMVEIAKSNDFLNESDGIIQRGREPQLTLLVYDRVLALGLYDERGDVTVRFKTYSDSNLLNSLDIALSAMGYDIMVVDKTESEDFMQRLKPRTEKEWIEYKNQILREIPGHPCPARTYLEANPVNDEMIAVSEYGGVFGIVHMKIRPTVEPFNPLFGRLEGIKCDSDGMKTIEGQSFEEVEAMLARDHSKALLLREPLLYCTSVRLTGGCCLANMFEEIYASKMGYDMQRKDQMTPGFFPGQVSPN